MGLMSVLVGDLDRVCFFLLYKGFIKLCVENGFGILWFGMCILVEVLFRILCDEY